MASCLLTVASCSPYRAVHHAGAVSAKKRVVVVEVIFEEAKLSKQVGGWYLDGNIVVDDHLPIEKGKLALEADSGHEVDSHEFASTGGVVAFEAPMGPLYILGARTASTYVVMDVTTLVPFITPIAPARSRCDYVGTIHVWGPSQFEVRDELLAHHDKIRSVVKGCDIAPNVVPMKMPPERSAAPDTAL